MKLLTTFLLLTLLSAAGLLSACAPQPRTVVFNQTTYEYQATQDGAETYRSPDSKTLQIERNGEATKIIVDGQVYQVRGTETQLDVTFPDGRELTRQYMADGSTGMTGLGVEASVEDWDRVDELREIVFNTRRNEQAGTAAWHYILGAIIFAIGLLQVINPRLAWQISEGWRYENLEPSEIYLGLSRLAGVVLMLVALFVAFGAWG